MVTKIARMAPPIPRGKIIGKQTGAHDATPADSGLSTSRKQAANCGGLPPAIAIRSLIRVNVI